MKEVETAKDEDLKRRLEFERTVSRISSRFVGVSQIDDAINDSLADMGLLSGADHAYLFLLSKDQKKVGNTHEWCSDGVPSQINNLQNLSPETYQWFMNKLRKGEVIHIEDVSKLPEEAEAERITLGGHDIKSVLASPLFIGGDLAGFIGFDNVTKTGQWNYDDFSLLRVSSEIIGRALERKRIEEELREGGEKYRNLFEESNDAIFIADVESGRILDANRAAERLLGIPKKEIIGMHQAQLHPQGKVQYYQEKFRKYVEAKHIVDFEAEVIRSDGSIVPVSISASVMMFQGREALQGIFRDITNLRRTEEELQKYGEQLEKQVQKSTAELVQVNEQLLREIAERERAEEALRESEERYRELVDLLPQTVFEVDERATVIFANRYGFDSFGYTQEDFDKGLNALQMLIPENRERATRNILKVLKGEQLGANEYTALRKDGSTFPVIIHSSPIIRENKIAGMRGIIIDITERKQAEEMLQRSEERYRGLFEYSPISLWEEDFSGIKAFIDDLRYSEVKDFRIYFENHPSAVAHCASIVKVVDVNEATVELYQAGSKEELLSYLKQVFGKKSLDVFKEELIALAEGKTMFESETPTKTLRGERKHIHLKWSIAPGYEESWTKVFVSVIDMTERKRVEEALRESEEKYRTLIETSPDPIVLTDLDGKILIVNKQALKLHGYDREEEMVGTGGFEFIAPEDHQRATEIMQQIFEKGNMRNVEYKLVKKDGTTLLAETSASLILDAYGKPKAITGMSRDITERKRMEEALRESEERYRSLVDTSPDAIVLTDLNAKIIMVNKRGLKMYGADSEDELIGKSTLDLVKPEEQQRVMEHVMETLETGETMNMEYTLLRKNGNSYPAEISASLIKDADGEPKLIIGVIRDITERKRAEMQLRESEEQYRTTLNSIGDAIHVIDEDFRIVLVNPALEKWAKELNLETVVTGKTIFEAFPFLPETIYNEYQQVFDTGETLITLENNKIGDKKYITEARKIPIFREGKVTQIVTIIHDITERKLAEEALQESQKNLQTLFNSLQDFLFVLDSEGRILSFNPLVPKRLGYSEEELLNKKVLDVHTPDQRDKVAAIFADLVAGKTDSCHIPLLAKDGTQIPVETKVTRGRWGDREVLFGLTRDITERKRMEEELKVYAERLEDMVEERTRELKESEEKLRSILFSSPDAITVADLNGNIIECNQATLDLNSFSSRDEVIGKNVFTFLAENDRKRAVENLSKTLEQGSTKNIEYMMLDKDGCEFPAEISAGVIRDASGNPIGFVGITKDITERKLMEEALLKSERLATIGEVATMVGHDLRNPLTGIIGAAYYLKKKLGSEIDEKTREILELIEKDIEYSNKIINDLLDYSREIQLELTETNPKKIIEDALVFVEIPENIRLVNLTTGGPRLKVDPQKMERAFTNIIKNSIEAMPEGGELIIASRETNGYLEIVIADTGLGIEKKIMDKIWTPLFTTKAKGLGVGLAICKRIVEAHGGYILVESSLRKGTIFTVKLPIEQKKSKEV